MCPRDAQSHLSRLLSDCSDCEFLRTQDRGHDAQAWVCLGLVRPSNAEFGERWQRPVGDGLHGRVGWLRDHDESHLELVSGERRGVTGNGQAENVLRCRRLVLELPKKFPMPKRPSAGDIPV